jgi:transposase
MSKKKQTGTFTLVHPLAAGIDVGASCHYVCAGSPGSTEVRRFGPFTEDLNAMADWLKTLHVKTAAMESTGIYWVNLADVLEAKGLQICVANARYVKNVPGRKSDVSDCQWIWQLHSFGLLKGSFIADEKIRELRAYVRQRESLEHQKSTQINMMDKALQLLNVKLRQVISKTETLVGMNIIRAIVNGERDGIRMSEAYYNPQMKASKAELAKALQGNWKKEYLFCLQQALCCFDFIRQQMLLCEVEIERCLNGMNGEDISTSKKKGGRTRQNDLSFKVDGYLNTLTGTDLTAIDGLEEKTILTIISETGTDMSKWKTASHFSSWLGLSPKPKKTGEKQKGHFKDSVAGRAGRAFRNAAASLHHNKGHLGSFYRRLALRRGSFVAIKATARKISVIFWNMLTTGEAYRKETSIEYEQKQQALHIRRLQKQAARFGLTLQKVDV